MSPRYSSRKTVVFYATSLVLTTLMACVVGEILVRRLHPEPTWSKFKARYLVDGRPDYSIPYYRPSDTIPYALLPRFQANDVRDTIYPRSRMDVTLNEEGFRTHPLPTPSTPNTYTSILLLGDSATFGYGAMERETFASRLEGEMRRWLKSDGVRVYNLGVPGYGPAEYYMVLNQYLGRIRPQLVVINLQMSNDVRDTELARVSFDGHGRLVSVRRPQFHVTKDGRLRDISNPLYRVWLLRDSALALYLYRRLGFEEKVKRLYDLNPKPTDQLYQEWKMILSGMQRLLDEKRIASLWVLLPSEWQLVNKNWSFETYFENVPLHPVPLNIAPLLEKLLSQQNLRPEDLYVDGSHFSPAGHALVAQLIFSETVRQYSRSSFSSQK